MQNDLLEFAQSYDSYKQKFSEKANAYFDSLVKQSAIDTSANKKSSLEYRKAVSEVDKLKDKIGGIKALKIFLIILVVGCFIAAAVLAYLMFRDGQNDSFVARLVVAIVCLVAAVVCILVLTLKIKKSLKSLDERKNEKQQLADKLYSDCMAQVRPLHNLFGKSVLYKMIEETLPIVKMDANFNNARFDILQNKYGLAENTNVDESTVGVFSGEVLGNPFVEERRFRMEMGMETYTGTKLITWTERYTDSEGHSRTRMRSETLIATVQKLKPFYSTLTRFIYGCEAAPDLSFSHQATFADDLSENQLKRKVKRESKALQRQARKAATTGTGNFTEMANQEFDVLFNAEDRDNEVQFRLMFTPLAQKNMLYLMKTPEPFGDDFDFIKQKQLNYIVSRHAQNWQFDEDSSQYMLYDADLCRNAMVGFYETFFRNFYFEVAPVMCIPLYQQHKAREFIYQTSYKRNYTSFESEVLANALPVNLFAHEQTETDVILKTSLLQKDKGIDKLGVAAYSFKTTEHIDYVAQLGGDGHIHDVPVHWLEYIPLEKYSEMQLTDDESKISGGVSSARKHGLSAVFIK